MENKFFNNTTRYIAIAICAVVMLYSGYKMYSLWQAKTLWGHLPVFFFMGFWGALQLALAGRKNKPKQHWRWLGFSTVSGVILSLSFPPIPLTFLLFIAFVPLLVVEKEISDTREMPSKWKLIQYAYNTFVIWNILTTWWVANTGFAAGIVAIWLNALFMCVPFLLFHQTKKTIPNLGYTAFVAFWLSFEMLHLNWEIAWVWLNLGNAFAEFPAWIQWYEYTGTFGGSMWVLLVNVLIIKWLFDGKKKDVRGALPFLGLILLPIIASYVLYLTYNETEETVEVVVGQPNYEPHYEKFTVDKKVLTKALLDLVEQNVDENTDYFILPETVFQINENKPESNATARAFKTILAKYPNLKLVSGVSAYHQFAENEARTPATRDQKDRSGKIIAQYEHLNAAVQYQKDQPTQTYRKSVFVPGAELLPYRNIFFFLKPLVDNLGGSMAGLGTQTHRSVFQSNKGNVAPVICYESVFGDYFTKYIRPNKALNQSADFVAIMTNDGWWDNTAGHKQHLKFASLRAIETRRDIARSANTGVSAFINQRGDIVAKTAYNERTALRGQVHLNRKITFYVQWGDLIGRLAVFLGAILILNTIARNWQARVK